MTGKTAAELVMARANVELPNMALQSWNGSRVRKQDVTVAKNYLNSDEIDTLNRLVVIFLDQAELRVKEKKILTLDFWRNNVDRLLEFNEKPLLHGAGSASHDEMKAVVNERYDKFDALRRAEEAREADAADLRELEELEKSAKKIREV